MNDKIIKKYNKGRTSSRILTGQPNQPVSGAKSDSPVHVGHSRNQTPRRSDDVHRPDQKYRKHVTTNFHWNKTLTASSEHHNNSISSVKEITFMKSLTRVYTYKFKWEIVGSKMFLRQSQMIQSSSTLWEGGEGYHQKRTRAHEGEGSGRNVRWHEWHFSIEQPKFEFMFWLFD